MLSVGYFGWASLAGYGALIGQWGLGVDQIIGAEVVDAINDEFDDDCRLRRIVRLFTIAF